jgi:hypothetical protein
VKRKPDDYTLRLRRAMTFLMKFDFLNAITDLEVGWEALIPADS